MFVLLIAVCSATLSPTPSPVILPSGTFQTDCAKIGAYSNRATIVITPPASPGQSNGFTYTNEIFLTAGCLAYDARLVASTSHISVTALPTPGEALLDVHVTTMNVTINNIFFKSFLNGCDGGNWSIGETRTLNRSCLVLGIALPSPSDCPVYYSAIRYTPTDIMVADFYRAVDNNITCSEAERFTNFSAAANYRLGGYGLAPSTCEPISNSSVCAAFIDFPVSVPVCPGNCSGTTCQSLTLEGDLYLTVLPQVWSVLSSATCRASVGRLFCSSVYSRCNTLKSLPCSITCDLNSVCSAPDRAALDRLLSLLGKSTSQLCSATNCAIPSPLPTIPLKALENPPVMSAKIISHAVAYPTCATYDGEVCKGLVNSSVYVPSGTTLYEMEELFRDQIWFTFGLAPKGKCFKAFTELACASVFNPCDVGAIDAALGPGVSVPVPLPRIPCRSMCEEYAVSCASFIALAPDVLTRVCTGRSSVVVGCANGSTITNASGLELYPVNKTVLQADLGLATSCNRLAVSTSAPFQCNYPTILPDDETSATILNGHCGIPCDSRFLLPWHSPGWNRFYSALIVFSCLFSGWTMATFLMFRDTLMKSQTQIYCFHCILAVFLATTIPIPVVFYNPSTAISYATCIDNTRPMTVTNPYCAYTGILVTWTTLTTAFFLNAFVVDLFLVVTLLNQKLRKETRDQLAKWTFIGIYGFSLIFAICVAATGSLTHSNLPYCFISGAASDVFWFICCVSVLVDVVLFMWVCKCIIASFKSVAHSSRNTPQNTRSMASQYRRPILFTLVFIFLLVVAIVFRLQVRFLTDRWKQYLTSWFMCNLIDARLSGAQCSHYPPGPNHGFFFVCNLLIYTQGIIISIIFGFTHQNIKLWKFFLTTHVLRKIGLARLVDRSQLDGSSDHDRSSRNLHLRKSNTKSTVQLDSSTHGHTDSTGGNVPPSPTEVPRFSEPVQTPLSLNVAGRSRTASLFLSPTRTTDLGSFD